MNYLLNENVAPAQMPLSADINYVIVLQADC